MDGSTQDKPQDVEQQFAQAMTEVHSVVPGVFALFGFQLWRVLHTGHVRWRVQKVHRHHRPVAYWFEVAACVVGLVLCLLTFRWTRSREGG